MNQLHRKYFHILAVSPFVIFGFFIDNFVSREVYIILSSIMLCGFLIFEYFRIHNQNFRQKVMAKFSYMYKEGEQKKIASSIYGPVDLLLLALFFSKPVVVVTLCVGCYSDPIAAIFGIKYGKKKNKLGKTMIGSIAFFLSSVILILLALSIINFRILSLPLVLLLAFFATIIEAYFPFGDDNFIMPMSLAVFMELLVRYM